MNPDVPRPDPLPAPTSGPDRCPETAIAHLAQHCLEAGQLEEREANELLTLFAVPPSSEGSGLAEAEAAHFVEATLQTIRTCLAAGAPPRSAFVNVVVQRELDRLAAEEGLEEAVLEDICDVNRRGSDRRYIFGQVKEHPDDPEDPSFFGGLWLVRCGGELRRVVFSIHADARPETIVVRPHRPRDPDDRDLEARVRARGPHPWRLQVVPDSPLGRWISGLCGTAQVGQLRGHIPLGVLGDAVSRALEARGVTHLLLGSSRRDAPTRPWHTGAFLTPLASTGDFFWQGHGIDSETDGLVETTCTVRTRAKIHRLERVP